MNDPKTVGELYKSYRTELYRDYPDVLRFERTKSRILLFMICFYCALFVAKAVMLGTGAVAIVIGVIMNVGVNMIFIAAALGPKWKIAFMLYLLFLYQTVTYVSSIINAGVSSFGEFIDTYVYGFSRYPLQCTLDVLTCVYILLLLLLAMWLTLVPENRRRAEVSDMLQTKMKEFMQQNPVR